jgi:hypothetical protein
MEEEEGGGGTVKGGVRSTAEGKSVGIGRYCIYVEGLVRSVIRAFSGRPRRASKFLVKGNSTTLIAIHQISISAF